MPFSKKDGMLVFFPCICYLLPTEPNNCDENIAVWQTPPLPLKFLTRRQGGKAATTKVFEGVLPAQEGKRWVVSHCFLNYSNYLLSRTEIESPTIAGKVANASITPLCWRGEEVSPPCRAIIPFFRQDEVGKTVLVLLKAPFSPLHCVHVPFSTRHPSIQQCSRICNNVVLYHDIILPIEPCWQSLSYAQTCFLFLEIGGARDGIAPTVWTTERMLQNDHEWPCRAETFSRGPSDSPPLVETLCKAQFASKEEFEKWFLNRLLAQDSYLPSDWTVRLRALN